MSRLSHLLRLASFFFVFSSLVFVAGKAEAAPASDRHFILITIDGFPSDLWLNPTLILPNLRKLAAEGATAKAMTVSNPSLTWINHTTLITGVEPRKHGVLFNGLLVRKGDRQAPVVEPWIEKSQMVLAPTLYDLAYEAGLTTAETNWVAITEPGTINWSFAELPDPEGVVAKEMIAAGVATEEEVSWMLAGPNRKGVLFRDSMWTRAAIHMFETHRPNLLLYHTLNTDSTHHRYGPRTPVGNTALEYADRLVGDLLAAVDRTGLREKTTIVVTTDHGFKKVTKFIRPNVILKEAGLLEADGAAVSSCDAYAVSQGGMAFLYVTDPTKREETLAKLKALFAETEGVAQVIDGEEGPRFGMPKPEENQGMGDLILFAKDGYAFRRDVAGEQGVGPAVNYGGTHGYPASDPELDGMFIINGAGIKPGVVLDRIRNLDVAPTLARMMGLELPETDGRVLEEVLK